MKYVLKVLSILYVFVAITGCDSKDRCEFGNGSRAFLGQPLIQCEPKKQVSPDAWNNAYKKGCKYLVPGRFKVGNKKSPYYKCSGVISQYPYLSEDLTWKYTFDALYCGKKWSDKGSAFESFFDESSLKRTGNLADE